MSWKERDPLYYGNEADGELGHGYWIRSADWEEKSQELLKRRNELFMVAELVKEGGS